MPDQPSLVSVPNLDMPGVEPYRTLRRQADHLRDGIFVAEGEKVVRRLLASGIRVRSMLLTPEWYATLFPGGTGPGDHVTFTSGSKIFIARKELLEGIVGFNLHQGIMAVAETPSGVPYESLTRPSTGAALLYVALDDLVNAENVGLVVRNCAAFGVDAIICGETSGSPYLRRAVRSSMGTVFGLPIHHSTHLPSTLSTLSSGSGVETIAADPAAGASLYATDLTGSVCIVVGHEGTGIRPAVLAACTRRVAIPMWNGTDSLNVSSACAVILSEARRQRAAR
jgi:tRNA G18 (ribose-2'-O)-methylase SpoU